MFAPRGFRLSIALACVAIALLIGGVTRLVLVRIQEGSSAADAEASVLGFPVAAGVVVAGVLSWLVRRRRADSLPPTAEQLDLAATTLARLVRGQWTAEARSRALSDPEPMPVRWCLQSPELMDYPSVIAPDIGLAFDGRSNEIARLTEAFLALPRHRLVIVGQPGTGKTTLAMQLLLELLAHARPAEPVPVMLSVVGWVPEEQPEVQDWLAAQLERTYPALQLIAAGIATTLVDQGRVLPILDGLDEVSAVRGAGILAALNSSLTGGVILTSRRAEYRAAIAAADVLTAAAVIEPQPLRPTDAADYLRKNLHPGRLKHTPEWDGVLTDLSAGAASELAAVTVTPLGLWLIRTVYIDGRLDPSGLVDRARPTEDDALGHLLDQLIPAVVRSRRPTGRRHREKDPLRPTRPCDPHDLRRWLTALAGHIADDGTGDWHWWRLAHYTFPTARGKLAVGCAVGTVVGVVLGSAMWLTIGRSLESVSALALGLLSGLTFGFGSVLVMRRRLGPGPAIEPRHATLRLGDRATAITVRVNRALLVGLPCALVLGSVSRPVIGLAVGLALGIASAVVQSTGSAHVFPQVASPLHSYRGDRRAAVTVIVVGSLLMGATVGMTAAPAYGVATGAVLGLTYGSAFGLAYGISNYAWPLFAITKIWSSSRRQFPWRLMPMLDDAYRLGLLRTVGSAYQFRHSQLQDHLTRRLAR